LAGSVNLPGYPDYSRSAVTTYSYDALGNLRTVMLPSGTTFEYLIDGQNRRVGKLRNGVLERAWLYEDQFRPSAELDGNGTVVTRFVYGTGVNVPDYLVISPGTSQEATYRVLTDHLGSVRLLIDATTGAIAQRIDYDEFGRVLNDTNPGFQPFGFAGGMSDPDTGLVRFGSRDYDSSVGRWTAKDAIRFRGGDRNLYAYLANDPVNAVDVTGHGSLDFFSRCKRLAGPLLLDCCKHGCEACDALALEAANPSKEQDACERDACLCAGLPPVICNNAKSGKE
jgi:RHS repeat-associated protein